MRPLSPARPVYVAAVIAVLLAACNNARDVTEPIRPVPAAARRASAGAGPVVQVVDAEQLYAAVNDPSNAGATILLAPGTYVLSAKDATGVGRPNGGRVELQQDMSLSGVDGDRAAVVIDASALPASSFPTPFGRTGVIRTGRGRNAVEWLTIAGNPLAAAGVETDLFSGPDAWVRVAHVMAGNSARGVDVRNVGAAMTGRRLEAEIEDNDFFRGVEGIRVANFVGATGGQITVVMSGNRSYQNVLGCILENNRSSFATIYVRSSGDRFEDNGWGCQMGGALVSAGTFTSSSTVMEAHGTHFTDNTRTEFFNGTGPDFGTHFGGVVVIGGDVLTSAGTTSHNTVVVRLWGCKVTGNQGADFEAYGARSPDASRIAGVDNHATIELYGVSKQIDVVGGDSSPEDPSGSNTLTIIR